MSRSFLNQVSTRELFTCGSKDRRSSQLSDSSSQNMYLNSLKEFSENSQDIGSQPFSGEANGQEKPQGRRVFDRFMTKRTSSDASFKSTPANLQVQTGSYNASMSLPGKQAPKPTFQQQVLLNKSKAKERDEREMFGTIVSAVKEYSEEVKGTIKTVQDNMEQLADTSNEQFSALANSIFDGLNENFERIVNAVKAREEKTTKIWELEKEISMRDAKIKDLKSEIVSQQTERDQRMFENLNKVIQAYHTETVEKIEKMHESVSNNSTFQHQLVDSQKKNQDRIEKQQKENQKTLSFRHEEIKNGLISELQQLRQDLEDHRSQLEEFYSTQLSTTHYKNMKEIQYHISSGFDKQTEQAREYSRDLCNFQVNKMKEICQNHKESQEKVLREKINEQAMHRNTQSEQILRKIEQMALHKKGNVQGNQYDETNDYQKKRSKDFETRDIQRQMDSMFERYNKELSNMRCQIEATAYNKDSDNVRLSSYSDSAINERNRTSVRTSNQTKLVFANNTERYDPIDTNYQVSRQTLGKSRNGKESQLKKDIGKSLTFVSPECRKDAWNTKPIFTRPNPSPVVAVLPQPQSNQNNEKIPKNIINGKKGKRKKKTYNQPSRKSQRLNRMQSDADIYTCDTSQSCTTSQERKGNLSEYSRNEETYADVFTRSYEIQKGKQMLPLVNDSQNGQPFKLPQGLPRPTARPFSSEQKFTDNIPCSHLSSRLMNSDKRPLQQNVFPERPSIYSSNSIRRCPPVVSAPQSIEKPLGNGRKSTMNSRDGFSQKSEIKSRCQNVYDFKDSPERCTLGIARPTKQRQEVPASSQSTVNESSRESSPSLSITKVIIQRKVKSNKRLNSMTPIFSKRESQENSEIMSDDFLNTPNMENKRNLTDKWESQSVSSTYRRSGEKRKLYNFNLGHELSAIKKAFKVPL